MKLWLLDADIIIDFLSIDVFEKLVAQHEVCVVSSVVEEIDYYKKGKEKIAIDFRAKFVDSGLIKELSATPSETEQTLSNLPPLLRGTLHVGEIESLTVLLKNTDLTFCSCDAATIRMLPLLNLSENGVSAEKLLEMSGLSKSDLQAKHTKEYFKTNLEIGQREKIYHF